MTSSFAAAVTTYDAAALPQRLAAMHLAQEVGRRIPAGGVIDADDRPTVVLDLGCGTGLATRSWLDQLQQSGQPGPEQVLLVDLAAAMVKRARAVVAERHGAVTGVVLDAFQPDAVAVLAPQLPPQGRRLLLSSYALQWNPTPLTVLQQVWAPLLRAGDWLALAVPDAGSFQALHQALAAAELPSHLLKLPEQQDLIGPAAQRALATQFQWVAGGSFANGVPVPSALAYLRHFALIGARPQRSPYARSQLVRLRRCLDQQLSLGAGELDYHSTWMLLRRR